MVLSSLDRGDPYEKHVDELFGFANAGQSMADPEYGSIRQRGYAITARTLKKSADIARFSNIRDESKSEELSQSTCLTRHL
jgi:hypothetical protein